MTEFWLRYFNVSDNYERKARFLPGVLSILTLLPLTPALGVPNFGWVATLLGTTGISAVLAVGLSHISSVFGNRLQRRLWPLWPHDSPTNRWLLPNDTSRSTQQKDQWYDAIKNITDLDIKLELTTTSGSDVESLINDAISQLRNRLWGTELGNSLSIHNCDYGFARNFAGLRPVWP